jgi:hypothetical protein
VEDFTYLIFAFRLAWLGDTNNSIAQLLFTIRLPYTLI